MLDYLSPLTVLLGLIVGIFVHWLLKKKPNLPPGPYPMPLIGNLNVVKAKFQHKEVEKYIERYGPIITVYIGPFPLVVVNSLELANEVLIRKGAHFVNRLHTTSLDYLSENRRDIIMGDYTPRCKLHRKIVSKALRIFIKGPSMDRTLHATISQVITMLKDKKESFNPKQVIDLTVFNIMCSICFDKSYRLDDDEFLEILRIDKDVSEALDARFFEDLVPYLTTFWQSPRYKTFTKDVDFVLEFLQEKIETHKQSFNPDSPRNLLDDLLKAQYDAAMADDMDQLSRLSDVYLRQTLMDVLFAGLDTSRFTLQWCFLYMAAYPEIQTKCQVEIDSVVDRERLLKLSDKPHLPYTEATLHEIMRIATVAPFGIPHAAKIDSTLGGYEIPKGTPVAINHSFLHMDPKYWSEPEKFNPTRFLESDGSLAKKPEAWLPFSAGQRVCVGQSFAKPEILIVFGSFLQKFTIQLPNGEKADPLPDGSSFGFFPKDFQIMLHYRV